MFVKKIGIDLGSSTTLVCLPRKGVVINEPSLVVFAKNRKEPLAVGEKAEKMLGRTPEEFQAFSPLKNGVIADYKVTQIMLSHFINKAIGSFQILKPEIVIAVPAGISSSEKRAVIEASLNIGAKNVFLIKEPLLAAIGAGIKIKQAAGHMIVDVGGGTSEIAVISLGAIVSFASLKLGGIQMTKAIIQYIRKKYNLEIGFSTAEKIKIQASEQGFKKSPQKSAQALSSQKETANHSQPTTIKVKGQDIIEGLPGTIEVQPGEINACLQDILVEIAQAVKNVLQETPPELSADILEEGITLTGGGALTKGLRETIQSITGIECHLAPNPLFCVIEGISYALKNLDVYKKALLSKKPMF